MTTSMLMWGVLFGSIGFGYFHYGRKEKAAVPFVCGLVLMVVPYFITNVAVLVCTGIVIAALPYFIRR